MSESAKKAAAYATIALGASQALVPRRAAKVFGMGDVEDGSTIWLARLLGVANLSLGAAALNPVTREPLRLQTIATLGADAAVTVAAAARGDIRPRTAVSVVAFVAAMLPAVVATD